MCRGAAHTCSESRQFIKATQQHGIGGAFRHDARDTTPGIIVFAGGGCVGRGKQRHRSYGAYKGGDAMVS